MTVSGAVFLGHGSPECVFGESMGMNALQQVNELLSRFNEKEVASFGAVGTASYTALRKLNMAQKMIITKYPWTWAEKTSPGQLTAVAGTSTYQLASDVAHLLIAKHNYGEGDFIRIIDRKSLEQLRPDRSNSGDRNTPKWMTTLGSYQSAVSAAPQLQVELWPVPDTNFDSQIIYYYYTVIPTDLSNPTDISIIPGDFDWLAIDLAEMLYRTGRMRAQDADMGSEINLFQIANQRFQDGLAQLIARESAAGASEMTWEPEQPSI